jgi:type II secretory pathway component PulF
VGQESFGKEIEKTLGRLREGKNFSSALEGSSFFPQMLCELVGAAEESGRLDQAFERLALSAKRESELKTKLVFSLLEPTLILGMGALVGFVAVAMLLPIFEMSANIR